MSRTPRDAPVELAPAPWPEVESADAFGEVARRFVLNVRAAIGSRSIRSVAGDAGLSHVTLLNVVGGKVWPDLATIARLESALGASLWPGAVASPSTPGGAAQEAIHAQRR